MTRIKQWGTVLGLLFSLGGAWITSEAADGILQIRNGYFWDPGNQAYFVPRGIAYQSWNPPVGANQSYEQIDYDLLEFKKMYANSVRCEFVWSQVQTGTNTWDWSKPEHLVNEAEKLGIKLFVIIGFQYPPAWFPPEWRGINEQGLTPDVLQCLGEHRAATIANPISVTNCLSKPIYDHLYTNATMLGADVINRTLSCLTSSVPSEIVGALEQKIPPDSLPLVLSAFISDVINYENPDARRVYTNYIAKVVDHFKNTTAIGAWIMGNECAYFDLWEDFKVYPVHRFIGYDPYSQAAFRNYLRTNYSGDIATLNVNWGTTYTNFDDILMPGPMPADRNAPALTDTIHWRQQSIGGFIASGALTARTFDPNHLLTYSMVGGIFSGVDGNNTCEDARSIVLSCRTVGAPLDFWSINNYAWASFGSELRTADWGITKYRELLNLPVMISETGHSSTENLFAGAGPRQAKALPGQVWESLMSGAIGTHIFHWNDRNQFTQYSIFNRERGFGIVNEDRTPKVPVYDNVLDMFRRMRDLQIERLLANSSDPPPDVQFFWSHAGDLTWPRANQENAMLWGALRRVGLQPAIITDTAFQQKAYTNAPVLLLSRCWQLYPADLETIATDVLNAGIHVHADADLPGQVDAYVRPNPNWAERMNSVFGLDVSSAVDAYDKQAINDETTNLTVFGSTTLGPITTNFVERFTTWKIWEGVRAVSGLTLLNDTGVNGRQANSRIPALQLTTHARAKTAITTYALADIFQACGLDLDTSCARHLYAVRYNILHAIYRDYFGIRPVIDISGPGAKHVLPDYRICPNGSVLISVLNEDTNSASITLSAPTLLAGKTVESLTSGGIITTNSTGSLVLNMLDDDYVLLYAYGQGNATNGSLVNPSREKVWFSDAPLAVWPRGSATNVQIGFDVAAAQLDLSVTLEQVRPFPRTFAVSARTTVTGAGTNSVGITVPDADLNDPEYLSSADGAEYVFHAILENNGNVVSDTTLPVRLLWSVRPAAALPVASAGGSYQVALEWQELPSYQPGDTMPMDRALLWQSLEADSQHFNVVLQLKDAAGNVVASDLYVTDRGSGTSVFTINVPRNAQGPLSWTALVQSAPQTGTVNIDDSFEGRNRGEDLSPFTPWFGYAYSDANNTSIQAQGIIAEPNANPANQVAYVTVQNPLNPGAFSGFGLIQAAEQTWSLAPNKHATFSFAFREVNRLPCVLEMQVKDLNNNWIQYTKPYTPDPVTGWDTNSATLDQFTQGSTTSVDPANMLRWALNIRMLQTNATYTGYFDHVLFTGQPPLADEFEDRLIGDQYNRLAPASAYGYDAAGNNDVLLNDGVTLVEHSDGTQSAFLVAWYQTNSGSFAGFGISYPFPTPWSLPADTNQWKNYSFAFDFKERDGFSNIMELQLTSPNTYDTNGNRLQHAINFTKQYAPGSNGWDTISATLDQFVQPGYFQPFDPTRVAGLVLNIQMQQTNSMTNVLYVGYLDNIRFHGPLTPAAGDATYGFFSSTNDFYRITVSVDSRGMLTITWGGQGVLESATNSVRGPWSPAGPTTSPATIPMTGKQQFFRVRQ
jgi:hypothetical protein